MVQHRVGGGATRFGDLGVGRSHPLTLDGVGEPDGALERAHALLTEWRAGDFDMLTVLDRRYPLTLRLIEQIPPVLFVQGRLAADDVGVSVVGSRDASDSGLGIAAAALRPVRGDDIGRVRRTGRTPPALFERATWA